MAGHTKSLTIFHRDMIERPEVELEKILTFIGHTVKSRAALHKPSSVLRQRLLHKFPLYSNVTAALNGGAYWDSSGSSSGGGSTGWSSTYRIGNGMPKGLLVDALLVGVAAVESEVLDTNHLTEYVACIKCITALLYAVTTSPNVYGGQFYHHTGDIIFVFSVGRAGECRHSNM